ncbi:ergothioneine biosynthesis glutamate--cysteine ligase EgtA, partial [Streptomyces niveus]
CFAVAQEALPRTGASEAVREAVAAFNERYVVPGRCPADDMDIPATGKELRA